MRTISTTIDIDAAPDLVWSVLTDFPAHAEWNPFFASISGTPAVGEQLRVVARKDDGSEGMVFRATVLDADPGVRLRWKGRLVLPGLFDGTHDFRLEPLADGRTRLHHGEEFRGLLVPLLGGVVRDAEAGFGEFNRALAERVAAKLADCSA